MTASSTKNSEARIQAQRQWNTTPCGALPTDEEDKAFFDRVEADRYRQQYWQQKWMRYDRFASKKVLEIGIGLGTDLKQFARAGAECYGVDITRRHLELTEKNFALEGFDVKLFEADATELPFPDNTFDCIHSFGVLHHIPDVEHVLAEALRVLKPGGIMLNAVYHKYSIAAASLLVRATMNGNLKRIGLDGVLATIESGADGELIKPYVKLYSKGDWRSTCEKAGFVTRRLTARQIYSQAFDLANRLHPLEGMFGWYVCGEFVRPTSPTDLVP